MWVTLASGDFIYGVHTHANTHMTRNMSAYNTTNTQTHVHFHSQKKLANKGNVSIDVP